MTLASSFLRRGSAIATALGVSASLIAQCAIDPNVGGALTLGDDQVSGVNPLGFSMTFAGASYDRVYVSSNGFVYLGTATSTPPTNSRCCNGTVTGMLADPNPMVCGLWQDLNPAAGGSVYFNALANKALITWQDVPEFGNPGSQNTFQIVLNQNGLINIVWDGNCAARTHTALVGWSPNAGAANPGASNLSALPFTTSSAVMYELFSAGTFDLAGRAIEGLALSPTSWAVSTPPGCATTNTYGAGCPATCDFYELFAPSSFDMSNTGLRFTVRAGGGYDVTACNGCFDTGFATNLAMTDDSLSAQSLPFSFPYCGGSTNLIDVCSNGFIWLQSGIGTPDFSPTVGEFFLQGARIAPVWMDLNPSRGGGVYFDATPTKALITWDQVPAFGVTGSSNTFQLQLFPNGDMIMSFQSVVNNQTTGGSAAITGFSRGNSFDPGPRDLSMVPYSTGPGIPLVLQPQAGGRPIIGTTFNVEVKDVRPASVGGVFLIGISNPNFDLGLIGMPGCTLLSSFELQLNFPVASPITALPLAIPNSNSLIGRSVNSQAVVIDLTLGTPLPAYASNGMRLTFGL